MKERERGGWGGQAQDESFLEKRCGAKWRAKHCRLGRVNLTSRCDDRNKALVMMSKIVVAFSGIKYIYFIFL